MDSIKEGGDIFAVLADEAVDKSNNEQLPLVLRFVDSERQIREEFVGYYECQSVTGEAIADIIKKVVCDLGLDFNKCIGQGYDGAGYMAGSCKGAAARIMADYPLAKYFFHCAAHKLNLCVVSTCSQQSIRYTMDTLGEFARFFNFSPPCQSLLGDKVQESCPRSKREKLLDICVTRWIGHRQVDAIEGFLDLAEPVLDTLETIANNHTGILNSDSKAKANGLYHTIATFQFIFAATLLREVMSLLRGLTTKH
ncbi:52 kDa repressor of the inhibitor of the protein kinase-like [Homarus americanus]|uniref:52 kDa repressor of the inhibitor of the protein kinase-like 5 n=1 Tax=Homarus americanus TaxID=6706 RepID=A0A8J5KB64_HOMAM|nr:52 kDa repressor of the inhibitor of the protein kinase-like [Homarus americanus]KAG7170066.1 52 kDa repressor of the inhibitor of the protein kinase-like 5 [Homarus americanus]